MIFKVFLSRAYLRTNWPSLWNKTLLSPLLNTPWASPVRSVETMVFVAPDLWISTVPWIISEFFPHACTDQHSGKSIGVILCRSCLYTVYFLVLQRTLSTLVFPSLFSDFLILGGWPPPQAKGQGYLLPSCTLALLPFSRDKAGMS